MRMPSSLKHLIIGITIPNESNSKFLEVSNFDREFLFDLKFAIGDTEFEVLEQVTLEKEVEEEKGHVIIDETYAPHEEE